MGLAERRAIKEFETNRFPLLKQEIDEAANTELLVEVKWETLAVENQADLYDESLTKIYFHPLVLALKSVCRDSMGQEAIKTDLKQIIIQNTNGIYYGDRWAYFQDGVLTLDHEPTTNVDSVEERTQGLIKVLENAL